MAAGDFLIRKNLAETDVLPNAGTNLDATWDTEEKNEGSAATYSAGTYTITNAGPHLITYTERFDTADTTNNERIEGQGRLRIGGVDQTEGAAEGYIRKASGHQEMIISGSCIYRTTSASTSLVTRFFRTDNSTTGTVNRVGGFGGVQILQLDDTDAFARYSTNATQTISTTEANVTSWTNDEEDIGFSRSGDTVTITNAGSYVMSVSGLVSITGTARTEAVVFAENGTTEISGARGHTHMRGADGCQNGAFNFTVIIDVAASDTITLRKDLAAGSTPTIASGMVWQFWRLPSGNETAIMEATTGDQNSAGDFAWDTLPQIDTAAFTATAGNSNIDVDNDGHFIAFWQMGKTVVDSVQRAYPMSRVKVGDNIVPYAAGASYHRNSGGIGTFMSQGATSIVHDVPAGTSININILPLAASGTVDVETGHFSLLNLEGLYTNYTYEFPPSITDFNISNKFAWGATDLIITGTKFEALQGTGKVEFWSDITGTTKVTQTINSWSDTSIDIDTVQGALGSDTVVYLVVTTDNALESNILDVLEGLIDYSLLITDTLKADHYWRLNNVYTDTGDTGPQRDMDQAVVGVWTFNTQEIVDNNTHSLNMSATGDRRLITDSPNMNITIISAERTLACWLQLNSVQHSLAAVWKEGGGVQNLAFLVGYGNVLLAQGADNPGNAINAQAWSDFKLATNRPYHICLRYTLNEDPKELRLYIDGVEQVDSDGNPLGAGSFNSHSGNVVWGNPDTNLETGGTDISYSGMENAQFSDFATWSDNSGGTNAGALDKTLEIRDILFRRGAIPDDIIVSATETSMQTSLDATADVRVDWPLSYRIEDVSGGGDLELILNNKVFDSKITSHLEYRGASNLTLVNSGTSNLDSIKVFGTVGGSITVINEVPINLTIQNFAGENILGVKVLLLADTGGNAPAEDSVTIVRGGGIATVTHTAHGLRTSQNVLIEGTNENEYNGVKTITVTSVNAYTFVVSSPLPATPATGTITSTLVLIDSLTDSGGLVSTIHRYDSDQPVTGHVRKGTSTIYYRTQPISSIIVSTGLTQTIFMIKDE